MKLIENKTFDEERALYGSDGVRAVGCRFDGPADGESAFKESRNIETESCFFNLRYPFWHDTNVAIRKCEMTELCRAALWYSENIEIEDTKLHGIKALRECGDIKMSGCDIISPEFGWNSWDIDMKSSSATGEYFMMNAKRLHFNDVSLKGKYSFQYIEDSVFENCNFDTKDAFWHAKNVVVRNSVIKGEYLAWYSTNLRLVRCKIIGTQPLCYCKGLVLEDCTMEGCDLSFENSEVVATVNGHIDSVKNPVKGSITADSIGEIIVDEFKWEGECPINVRKADDIA
jgi:hypothetical protein